MTWAAINVITSVTVFCLIGYILGAYGHRLNILERIGFGLTGAGAIMTIGAVLSKQDIVPSSPYDDWAACLFRLGIIMSMIGVIGRVERWLPTVRLAPLPCEKGKR